MSEPAQPSGPLQPLELATAAVLGGLAVMLVMVGWWVPHASVVGAAGAIPFGVVAHRHRPRAVIASTVGASAIGFLMAGTGPVSSVFTCALVGGMVGDGKRRGWGFGRVMALAVVVGPVLAVLADGLLATFSALRNLTLAQVRNSVHGLALLAAKVPGLGPSARAVDSFVHRALADWWITVAALIVIGILASTVVAWIVLGHVLERLAWLRATDRLGLPASTTSPEEMSAPRPLPVALLAVGYRYPGSATESLRDITLRIDAGDMVAVTGHNGSGKSTLTRLLAGRPPTAGSMTRAGPIGLGRPGGTAMVFQRPESQVLGVRVSDDVVWGLSSAYSVDVPALLAVVGLSGMEDRETSTLSGGELQRLAVAAALAREPKLLISDESTAMVDSAGRRRLTDLFARLPAERGVSVVHVTHRAEEAAAAGRRIHLVGGRITTAGEVVEPAPSPDLFPIPVTSNHPEERGSLAVHHVSHVWAQGTPWEAPALKDVNFEMPSGAGVLVVGDNGSGKSTLAWIIAGLLRPSDGGCLLDGRPVFDQVGAIGLAFQHSRLQVQRPTVRADVEAAGGVPAAEADAALAAVGLEPIEIGHRHTDELSGGQLRRVALAGLLARRSRVLVLDEPLAGLDQPSTAGLLDLLARLRRDHGLTLIVISHDLEGVESVCDRVLRLEDGRVSSDERLVSVSR
ncbi:MAG: DUF2232 domain-containing protein [Actinomycetota bacterium]|nr:DUF2232 domain-containing protein [Actinomycetota bacterium]